MSTYNVDDDDSSTNHIPFKTKYVDWVKEITVVRRQFERMMRIVMDYQTEFIFDRNNMKSNPGYEELFNDNTILLADTLTNLIKIEKELISQGCVCPRTATPLRLQRVWPHKVYFATPLRLLDCSWPDCFTAGLLACTTATRQLLRNRNLLAQLFYCRPPCLQ